MLNKMSWKDQTPLQKRVVVITVIITVILIVAGMILFTVPGKESYFYLKLGQLIVCPVGLMLFATGFSLRDVLDPGNWKTLRITRCGVLALGTVFYPLTCEWQEYSAVSADPVRYWGASQTSLVVLAICLIIIGVITAVIKTKELTLQAPRLGDLDRD